MCNDTCCDLQRVFLEIKKSNDECGCNIKDLMKLGSEFYLSMIFKSFYGQIMIKNILVEKEQLKKVLDFMEENGILYTTIDEETYRCD